MEIIGISVIFPIINSNENYINSTIKRNAVFLTVLK